MHNPLTNIDDKLTEYQQEIINIAISNLTFLHVCEFFPNETIDERHLKIMETPGIYFIEVKSDPDHYNSFEDWALYFKSEWEKPEYIYEYVPNLKKKRIEKHKELKEWVPLYLGKSKWIKNRIQEHLYLDLKRHTFALKLSSRSNLKNKKFRLSIIPINVKNYEWILPQVERTLRDEINPIIGRQ